MRNVLGVRERQSGGGTAPKFTLDGVSARSTVASFRKGEIVMHGRDSRPVSFGEVRVAVQYISISPGTDSSELRKRSQLEAGSAGTRVGVVVEVGPGVNSDDVRLGDVIYADGFYEDQTIVDTKRCDRNAYWGHVDPRIPAAAYTYVKLAAVALNAMFDTASRVDDPRKVPPMPDTIVIVGLGVIGQIATQLATIYGAKNVVVLDKHEKRVDLAMHLNADRGRRNGASVLPALSAEEVSKHLRDIQDRREKDVSLFLTKGQRSSADPNVAVDFTGSQYALAEALQYIGMDGRIVVPAWHHGINGITPLPLEEEFHTRRISLVSSQVGKARPEMSSFWRRQQMCDEITRQMSMGALDLGALVTQVLPFEQDSLKFCFDQIAENNADFIGPVLGIERNGAALLPPAQTRQWDEGLALQL